WNNELWLIDNGASFYFHHAWRDPAKAALDPFPYIKNHVFLGQVDRLEEADRLMRQAITPRTLSKIVGQIPDEWLDEENSDVTPGERRRGYETFLLDRLKNSRIFVDEAIKQQKLSGL
ncbi:MAG: aminotransferase class I and II, partial [Muribaculaceae bacterium]|nr:aminotransferase class I and II [Muribaculaceae bacterium]